MAFKSDAQRKGFFGSRGFVRSQLQPLMQKSKSGHLKKNRNNPTRRKPKIDKEARDFISKKISILTREGKRQDVAIGRAFSEARRKFGEDRVPKIPSMSSNQISQRTRRLLFTLLGFAIALRILRQFRTK